MRMRRKKHREDRLENCSDIIIGNIMDYADDLGAVFEEPQKPLCLEIGCGKGTFITETAKKYPDVNFIAFEKNLDVAVLAVERAKAAGLSNVKFVTGNADYLKDFTCSSACERIYINFCDPWAKVRYAKRRLTHANYLTVWQKLLKEGGELHFKTDNRDLFEFSLNSFSDFGLRLKNISLNLHASGWEGNIMTEYETMFAAEGKPIYRCEVVF
ncbi:MAG: tRNA (guanosine(46)-N7)-methyltransferase TrmB [Clostridia bacterium]|nr:tRNA (guanosine(46)-N7)-methyltransferase TrmB [Clostridia bacterium]